MVRIPTDVVTWNVDANEVEDVSKALHDTSVMRSQVVELDVGCRVRIRGLLARTDLNSKFGTITSVPAEPEGRYSVVTEMVVDKGDGCLSLMETERPIAIKRANLEVAPPRLPHAIMLACTHGRIQEVTDYLDGGGDIDAMHALHHDTLLTNAACTAHSNIVEELLLRGANVNLVANHAATALHMAAYMGNRENARLLVEAHARLDLRTTSHGYTPVDEARAQGHLELAELLTLAAKATAADAQALFVEPEAPPVAVAPPPSDEEFFAPGTRVVVHGLKTNYELNGRAGEVEGYDALSGRFVVRLKASGLATSHGSGSVVELQNERVLNIKPANLNKSECLVGEDGTCKDFANLSGPHQFVVLQAMQAFGEDIAKQFHHEPPTCLRQGICILLTLASAPRDVVTGVPGSPEMTPEEMVYRIPAEGVGGFIYCVIYRGREGTLKLQTVYRATADANEKHFKQEWLPGHEHKQMDPPVPSDSSQPKHVNLS